VLEYSYSKKSSNQFSSKSLITLGIHGSQSISYLIFRVTNGKLRTLVPNSPLPLSPKATLSWIGFSDEGTPVFSDSKETVRVLHGQLWSPYCWMKELLNGQSDHFWVVGVSETAQNIRAVKCKGAKYPPALPRPILMMLDAKVIKLRIQEFHLGVA